ncbi:MAG TPA: hypothetical protein VNS63_05960 [Blastocatellia bacterium]|nr:hypothetical protein [Blastocatellia bacterium]
MSKHHRKNAASKAEKGDSAGALVFYPAVAMLVLVPLAFSTSLNAKYALPKFAVLLVGSSLLTVLLVRPMALSSSGADRRAFNFKSPLVRIVILYLVAVSVSTLFGVAPLVSFFGTNSSFMGLLTRLCFVVWSVSLIVGISASERRLLLALRAMALAGFLVSAYAVAQFFGVEPFGALSAYTFARLRVP